MSNPSSVNNATVATFQWAPEASHPCTIVSMDQTEYLKRFGPSGLPPLYQHPLVIRNNDNNAMDKRRNLQFQQMTLSDSILNAFPQDFKVTLSSSNSFSEHRRTIPFSQYLNEVLTGPDQLPHQQSNETWYLFGETYSDEWKTSLLQYYQLPICHACVNDSNLVALSFGIGNRGSGVQWHVHGPGFSEAVHGRKHWILQATKPDFHPDQTSLNWMEYTYAQLSKENRPYECTLEPGDLIYFPDMWWHATINLDPYTAFISTFTQEHVFAMDENVDDTTSHQKDRSRLDL